MTAPGLTWTRILAYGVPGLPLALPGLPLAVYLPAYYTRDVGLSLLAMGSAVLIARLFDIVSDPAIGLYSDRLRQRGRSRRRLMLIGVPVMLLGILQLFSAPDGAAFGYLLTWNLVTYGGWTLIAVPYYAWGAELSAEPHTRTRLAGAREGFTITGVFIAIALPTLLGIAAQPDRVLDVISHSLWLALPLAVVIATVLAPERAAPGTAAAAALPALRMAGLLANRPMRRLIAAYLLSSAANALPAALFIFYVTHVLQAEAAIGSFLGLYFLAGIAALPLWVLLSRHYGKARVWRASMLLACAAFVWAPWLGTGDLTAYGLICLVTGIALGADLALPASLQADMVDIDARQAGRQRAGLLFGLWGLATKLAAALGIGIAFGLLAMTGFDPRGTNTGMALLSLALLYGLAPVVLKGVAITLTRGITADMAPQRPLPAGEEVIHVEVNPGAADARPVDERLQQHAT
jgi:GPH family glycoside/pentoside/hexuronide:cation symporter